ncbi:MAG: TadE/TadG family type IV pilus assembly protein [Nitrospinota bacterium]
MAEPSCLGRLLRWRRHRPLSRARNGHAARATRGQALVEFALTLPLLLLLLLGVVEFARAYFTYHLITNATREGARIGIITGKSGTDVNNAVQNRLSSGGLTATPTITVTGVDGASAGDLTTVAVSYPFQSLSGSFIPGWSGMITLSQTTVMRHE